MRNRIPMIMVNFIDNCFGYAIKHLDLIASVICSLMGLIIFIIGSLHNNKSISEIGSVLLTVALIYLIFHKKILTNSNENIYAIHNRYYSYLLNIIFLFSLILSYLIAHNSVHRPNLYFILTSVSITALSIEILYFQKSKYYSYNIFKILLISISVNCNTFYDFSGYYGVDPWYHMRLVEEWSRIGHINYNQIYSNFPIFHLEIINLKYLTNLNPKDSLFFSIGLIYCISVLFLYLIGRSLLGSTGGLLAALLLSTSEFFILWGAWIIPTSLGVFLISSNLYLIMSRKKDKRISVLIIILTILLVLAHSLSSFVSFMIIIFLYFGYKINYKAIYISTKDNLSMSNIDLRYIVLFFVIMAEYWISVGYTGAGQLSFFNKMGNMFFNTISSDVKFTGSLYTHSDFPLNRIGILIYIGLMILGTLYWLNSAQFSREKCAILFSIFALIFVIFLSKLMNIEVLLPERWIVFVILLGVLIAAQSILILSKLIKIQYIILLIFCGSYFMINTYTVNPFTPFYGELSSDPTRFFFSQSEINACNTILKTLENYGGNIATDAYYCEDLFQSVKEERDINISITEFTNENKYHDVIIIRKYVINHIINFPIDEITKNNLSNYSLIYDDSDVKVEKNNN